MILVLKCDVRIDIFIGEIMKSSLFLLMMLFLIRLEASGIEGTWEFTGVVKGDFEVVHIHIDSGNVCVSSSDAYKLSVMKYFSREPRCLIQTSIDSRTLWVNFRKQPGFVEKCVADFKLSAPPYTKIIIESGEPELKIEDMTGEIDVSLGLIGATKNNDLPCLLSFFSNIQPQLGTRQFPNLQPIVFPQHISSFFTYSSVLSILHRMLYTLRAAPTIRTSMHFVAPSPLNRI